MGLDMFLEKGKRETVEVFGNLEEVKKAVDLYNDYMEVKTAAELVRAGKVEDLNKYPTRFTDNGFETDEEKEKRLMEHARNLVDFEHPADGYIKNIQASYKKVCKNPSHYKKAYDFYCYLDQVGYWRKDYELNDLIFSVITPEELKSKDTNCVRLEMTKEHVETILASLDELEEDYTESTKETFENILSNFDFDNEILVYHEWY